jgi:hypothetical protein
MEVLTRSASVSSDPAAKQLYEYLAERDEALQLEQATVFFN